jgi:vancomycin permeability regulator SanA
MRLKRPSASTVKRIAILLVGVVVIFTLVSYFYIETYASHKIDIQTLSQQQNSSQVAIVFGAGIDEQGRPKPLLRSRLDAAADLYEKQLVRNILVSGDNRFESYNEPEAMKFYLMDQKGIPEDAIQTDYAGRSTYETCERAVKIFQLEQAALVTNATHMPRALFLCRHFGLEAYGFVSSTNSSRRQLGQVWREIFARNKAIVNAYVIGEQTILGDPIPIKKEAEIDGQRL